MSDRKRRLALVAWAVAGALTIAGAAGSFNSGTGGVGV
jgi:hypothetical protein